MVTSYDNQLNDWVNKEKSGVNLLNSVGTLMYDKGIELVLFRNKLLEIGVSELLNYISYANNVVGRENNIETAISNYYLLDLKLGGNFLSYNWGLKANNVLGNEYHTYGVSSAFCQQDFSDFCKRESVYPMPEQTFTFSLSRDF